MAKITLQDTQSGYSLSKINANFDTLSDAINNNILWRTSVAGEDNSLQTDLDINGKTLYNVGQLSVIDLIVNGLPITDELAAAIASAQAAATAAGVSATSASVSANSAASSLASFNQEYLGALSNDPLVVGISQGALYYNTTTLELKYLRGTVWTSFPVANQVDRTQLVKPTDFTTGTTVLTLPATSFTKTILWVMQDGAYTNPALFTLTDQTHITLTTGVASTVSRIEVAYIAPLASAIVDDGSITTAKLAASSVTSTILADNSVVASKIPDFSITSTKYQTGSINSNAFAAGSVNGAAVTSDATQLSIIAGKLGTIKVVTSIAALRALPLFEIAAHAYILVTGYYAANDGGGGLYLVTGDTTSADNGGTRIVNAATNQCCYLQEFVRIDIRQFGAIADNTTNNAATIQAAITWCTQNGLRLHIPVGLFVVSSVLTLATYQGGAVTSGLIIEGEGPNSVIAASASFPINTPIFTGNGSGFSLRDFCIDGRTFAYTGVTHTKNTGVITTIERMNIIRTVFYGVYVSGGDNYAVRDCFFNTLGSFAVYSADNGMNSSITGNTFLGCSGVYLGKITTQPEGVRISDNTFLCSAGGGEGIHIDFGLEIIVCNNIIDQCTAFCMQVRNNTSHVRISNNWLHANVSQKCLFVDGNTTYIRVINNTFDGGTFQCDFESAGVGASYGHTIANNVFYGINGGTPSTQSITVVNGYRVIVSENQIFASAASIVESGGQAVRVHDNLTNQSITVSGGANNQNINNVTGL